MSVYFKAFYIAASMMALFVVCVTIAEAILSYGQHAAFPTYIILKMGFAYALFILTIFISPPRKYYFVIAASSLVLFEVSKDLFNQWKFDQTDLSLIEFYLTGFQDFLLIWASCFFLIFSGCIFTSVKALIAFKKEKPADLER